MASGAGKYVYRDPASNMVNANISLVLLPGNNFSTIDSIEGMTKQPPLKRFLNERQRQKKVID
jgi:hypothetical protein